MECTETPATRHGESFSIVCLAADGMTLRCTRALKVTLMVVEHIGGHDSIQKNKKWPKG